MDNNKSYVNCLGLTLSDTSYGNPHECTLVSLMEGRTNIFLHGSWKSMREFGEAILKSVEENSGRKRDKLQKELDDLLPTMERRREQILKELELY